MAKRNLAQTEIIYHCAECGRRLNIVDGYAICPRCHFDLTGEDTARERLRDIESPRERTET